MLISGVVRDGVGRPVAQARMYVTDGPEPFPDIAALTMSDGSFRLSVASEGTYTLGCSAEGFAPTSVTVLVRGDQGQRVEIRLQGQPT